jgi:hypothetical protein
MIASSAGFDSQDIDKPSDFVSAGRAGRPVFA